MKDERKQIIVNLQKNNARIAQINEILNLQHEQLFYPEELEDDEENKYEVKDEEINQFIKEEDEEAAKKKKKKLNDAESQDLTQEQQQKIQQEKDLQEEKERKEKEKQDEIKMRQQEKIEIRQIKERPNKMQQPSEFEGQFKLIQEIILKKEKEQLLLEINKKIDDFDLRIFELKQQKNLIESDVLMVYQKLLTKYQEFLILEDMEEEDNKLIKKLQAYRKEKNDLEDQIDNIVEQLVELNEIDQQKSKERKEKLAKFNQVVFPNDDIKREKIHDYYAKKLKKEKTKIKQNENEEEENEEEDIEDDDDESEEQDNEDKNDLEVVKQDQEIKELIKDIVNLEDQQETNKKQKEALERKKNNINQEAQKIDQNITQIQEEIKNFQREKLKKTNKIDVAFFLKLSQIQNLEKKDESKYGFMLPEDTNKTILFTENGLLKLCQRIEELDKQSKESKVKNDELKREYKILKKEKEKQQQEITRINKEYRDKYLLKFGDIIDLKLLDSLEPSKQVLEARAQFKQEERASIKQIEQSKNFLMTTKKKLLDAKKENTKIISSICELGKEQNRLNKALEITNKQLFKEDTEEKKDELEKERTNLKELVKFLSKEINDLKAEIGVFKTKGGHIYTMVTSNNEEEKQQQSDQELQQNAGSYLDLSY